MASSIEGPVSGGGPLRLGVLPDAGISLESEFILSIFTAVYGQKMTAPDNSEEAVIQRFEQTLSELKEPLLDRTDETINDNQDVHMVLDTVGGRMEELHNTIKTIIENNGQIQRGGALNLTALYQLLEERGIFTSLRANPALKEPLLRSLRIYLLEYPWTRSKNHVRRVVKDRIPSHQKEIIPNRI
jgi:hypothetical protein